MPTLTVLLHIFPRALPERQIGLSLPFAFDDPNQSEDKFKSMLIQAFGGASLENDVEKITPRCVPIITANDHIINALTDDHAR